MIENYCSQTIAGKIYRFEKPFLLYIQIIFIGIISNSFAKEEIHFPESPIPSIVEYEEIVRRANLGIRNDQLFLGTFYVNGYHVEQNFSEAAQWYRKAAINGSAKAQRNLAVLYDHGLGVQQDHNEAWFWYMKAVEQLDAAAHLGVGGLIYGNHYSAFTDNFYWPEEEIFIYPGYTYFGGYVAWKLKAMIMVGLDANQIDNMDLFWSKYISGELYFQNEKILRDSIKNKADAGDGDALLSMATLSADAFSIGDLSYISRQSAEYMVQAACKGNANAQFMLYTPLSPIRQYFSRQDINNLNMNMKFSNEPLIRYIYYKWVVKYKFPIDIPQNDIPQNIYDFLQPHEDRVHSPTLFELGYDLWVNYNNPNGFKDIQKAAELGEPNALRYLIDYYWDMGGERSLLSAHNLICRMINSHDERYHELQRNIILSHRNIANIIQYFYSQISLDKYKNIIIAYFEEIHANNIDRAIEIYLLNITDTALKYYLLAQLIDRHEDAADILLSNQEIVHSMNFFDPIYSVMSTKEKMRYACYSISSENGYLPAQLHKSQIIIDMMRNSNTPKKIKNYLCTQFILESRNILMKSSWWRVHVTANRSPVSMTSIFYHHLNLVDAIQ